jgi:uracil-DNA glycosylase
MALLEILGDWYQPLKPEFDKPYMQNIGKLLTLRSEQLEPKGGLKSIFRAYELCQRFETKVVILGQDPYPGGQANGLAFSSSKMTASLKVIFDSLEKVYGIRREDPDLTDWAKKGVLLLNSSLTCYKGKSDSCREWGWDTFISASLK